MRGVAALFSAIVVLAASAATAMTIRGDSLWRSESPCPKDFQDPAASDASWLPVTYPWMGAWPRDWPTDPEARPFWDAKGYGITCVRRTFQLDATPTGPAIAHVWVVDDYDFYVNGTLVAENHDHRCEMPGETYDISAYLRPGRNVLAMRLVGGGLMAALVSIDVPGVPDPPRSAEEWSHLARPWLIVLGFIGGGFALGAAIWLLRVGLAPLTRRIPAPVLALLSVAAAAGCQYFLLTHPLYTAPWDHPRAEWNWAPIAMATAIFAALLLVRPSPVPETEAPVPSKRAWLLMLGILGLALFLRTYLIDSIPVGFWGDESLNGNEAIDYLKPDALWTVWSPSVGGRGTLFIYIVGVVLKIFGVSYLSLKIVPVAMGVAAIAAVYAFARVGFGPRTALWAAFFLAVMRWHIHFSRMAWEAICVPLIAPAGFALLLYGLGTGRRGRASLLASGVLLSLGLYTYAAYRAIPAVVVVFVIATLLSRQRRELLAHTRPLLGAAVLATLVATPLVLYAIREPVLYWARYNDVALTSYMTYYRTPVPWLIQFAKGFLAFNSRGDELVRHNLPLAPHLDPVMGGLFLLGLAVATGIRSHGVRLLWCWLFVYLALATLTRDGPHATRLLGLTPAAAVFAALAVSRLGAPLVTTLGWRPLSVALGLLLAVAATASNAYQYFQLEAHHLTSDYMFDFTARSLCEYIRPFTKIELYWSDDLAFLSDSQCHFLARYQNTRHDIPLAQLIDGSFKSEGPPGKTIVVLGAEYLMRHRREIPFDDAGVPQLKLPGYPRMDYDRQGRLLYALWHF